jgi:hypothetical protein
MFKTCLADIFNEPQRHREHGEEKGRGEGMRDKLGFLPLDQLCRQM